MHDEPSSLMLKKTFCTNMIFKRQVYRACDHHLETDRIGTWRPGSPKDMSRSENILRNTGHHCSRNCPDRSLQQPQ